MANITASKKTVGNSIAVNAGDLRIREMVIRAVDIVNAGTYATDDTATFQIPVLAGEVVVGVGAKLIEAFAGSGDQLNMTVGDGDDADGFLASAALHVTQTEITSVYNTGAYFTGTDSNTDTTANVVNGKLYTADDTIDILFDGTAGAAIDLDALTDGSVKVKVAYLDLN